jgi:hypothetical protein
MRKADPPGIIKKIGPCAGTVTDSEAMRANMPEIFCGEDLN